MGRRFSFSPLAKWQWQAAVPNSPRAEGTREARKGGLGWPDGHTNLLLRQRRSALLDPCGLLSLVVWPSFWTKNNAVHFGSLWPDMARTHDWHNHALATNCTTTQMLPFLFSFLLILLLSPTLSHHISLALEYMHTSSDGWLWLYTTFSGQNNSPTVACIRTWHFWIMTLFSKHGFEITVLVIGGVYL